MSSRPTRRRTWLTFSGAARRFQELGRRDGVVVVDDYAHHPTEIAATLTAAKRGGHERVIAVFQPHLFSRTRYLQREFGRALTLADEAIVTEIFPAREEPEPGVSGKLDRRRLPRRASRGPGRRTCRGCGDVVRRLAPRVRPGDLVLTLGAGDVFHAGEQLLATLAAARGRACRRRMTPRGSVLSPTPREGPAHGHEGRRRRDRASRPRCSPDSRDGVLLCALAICFVACPRCVYRGAAAPRRSTSQRIVLTGARRVSAAKAACGPCAHATSATTCSRVAAEVVRAPWSRCPTSPTSSVDRDFPDTLRVRIIEYGRRPTPCRGPLVRRVATTAT